MSIFGKWPNFSDPFPAPAGAVNKDLRTDAALAWLRRSIEVTGNRGSAHSYSPVWGWQKAYPETTGYIIDTLCDYAAIKNDPSLVRLAVDCGDWLTEIQFPDGAFPALLEGSTRASVFNTAQILFGLARIEATQANTAKPVREALQSATAWLTEMLEPDFSWKKHAYVPGFTPSYYTRAVWGVLKANTILQLPEVESAMRKALHFYAGRMLPDGTVQDWGFRPGKPAFTHTIAYTLEGFLESASLLDEQEIIEKKILAGEKFLKVRNKAGCTAGRYDTSWNGDYSFVCVTGNCQLSIFLHRLWEISGREQFKLTAQELLEEVFPYQYLGNNPEKFGAMPGSAPFWGPYLRFRYPNWAVKFFLDAIKHLH